MKILFYSASLSHSAGGLYNSVSGLAKALKAAGIDIRVAGGADEFFEQGKSIWGDVPIYPYDQPAVTYGLRLKGLTDLREIRPDIVHIHGIWAATSIYGRAATLLGIPTVVSPRGMLDPWILARRPLIKRVHASLFERPMLRRAFLHALNEAESSASAAFMPSLADRIFVVPNGIPEAVLPQGQMPKRGALFLGRLHSKKQTLELIRAWENLGANAERLTVAGWGDENYQAAVTAAAAGATHVEFVGPVHGESKSAALRRAQFFILPSLSEGLPMAVLEALQHGCIPIITDACNLPELFRDGIALRLEADFSNFSEVMNGAIAMPDSEKRQRSIAAAQYAGHYLWPNLAQRMIEQYERILKAKTRSPASGI